MLRKSLSKYLLLMRKDITSADMLKCGGTERLMNLTPMPRPFFIVGRKEGGKLILDTTLATKLI